MNAVSQLVIYTLFCFFSCVQVPFPLAVQLNIMNIPQHGTAAIQVTQEQITLKLLLIQHGCIQLK